MNIVIIRSYLLLYIGVSVVNSFYVDCVELCGKEYLSCRMRAKHTSGRFYECILRKVSLIPTDVKRNLVYSTQTVASNPENVFCIFCKPVL